MKKHIVILLFLPAIALAQFAESQLVNTEWGILPDNFFSSNKEIECNQYGEGGECIRVKLFKDNKLEYWSKNISWEEKGSLDMHSWQIEGNKIIFWINNKFLRFEGDIKYVHKYNRLEISGKWKNRRSGVIEKVSEKNQFTAYLLKNQESFLNFAINQQIKYSVEESIKEHYKKGEFEKTSTYQKRIEKIDKNKLIEFYQKQAIHDLKKAYKKGLDLKQEFKILDYDPDNETFAFSSDRFGDIFLEVPLKEAKQFKEAYIRNTEKSEGDYIWKDYEFEIHNNSFVLSKIIFEHRFNKVKKDPITNVEKYSITNKNTYVYNTEKEIEYVTTDIDYDIGEININNIESKNTTNKSTIKRNKLSIHNDSSVDKNIPENKKVKNRYALVIGNEDYQSKQRGLSDEQNVDYAVNDAIIFKEYALKTLGVEEDNMFFLTDATAVEMGREIKRINKIMSKLGSKGELIVYYAGHGHPDEKTNIPYLIPVDVSANDLSYAIKLDEFYQKLSKTNSKRITIFLDACFTGGGRSSGLMASRGVRIKPKGGTLDGNIVVFSASSGDQSALPYHKENHGMFTYHLLKKLQESKGNIKMGELANYLQDEVSLKSLKINDKEQDPVVNTSKDINTTWKEWEF